MTFCPDVPTTTADNVQLLNLPNLQLPLYTHSFLGFGQEAALTLASTAAVSKQMQDTAAGPTQTGQPCTSSMSRCLSLLTVVMNLPCCANFYWCCPCAHPHLSLRRTCQHCRGRRSLLSMLVVILRAGFVAFGSCSCDISSGACCTKLLLCFCVICRCDAVVTVAGVQLKHGGCLSHQTMQQKHVK